MKTNSTINTFGLILISGAILFYYFFSRKTEVDGIQSDNVMGSNTSAYTRLMDPDRIRNSALKAETKRLLRWKKEFPWPPTHDPKIDALEATTILNGDKYEHHNAVTVHQRLSRFYNDEIRYSHQFEQVYNVLEKHGMAHNPIPAMRAFKNLRAYARSSSFAPDEILLDEHGNIQRREGQRNKHNKNPITMDEIANSDYNQIIAGLSNSLEWVDKSMASKDSLPKLEQIAYDLATTVSGMNELPLDAMIYANASWVNGPDSDEYQDLVTGDDQMLVPYIGWYDESIQYFQEIENQFNYSVKTGDPSLKQIAPGLFPPVGINDDNLLIDKNGDEIKMREGIFLRIIHDGQIKTPQINEDGTIIIPSPSQLKINKNN